MKLRKLIVLSSFVGFLLSANGSVGQVVYGNLNAYLKTANGTTTSAGSASNPYLITSARDLDTLSWYVRGGAPSYTNVDYSAFCSGTYFKITQHIDMSVTSGTDQFGGAYTRTERASNFIPIGGRQQNADGSIVVNTNYQFRGRINYNVGVTDTMEISNLNITGTNTYTGLIGYLYGNQISYTPYVYYIKLINPHITGGQYTGGIVAYTDYSYSTSYAPSIYYCFIEGGSIAGASYVGGVVGYLNSYSYFYYSGAKNTTITGTSNSNYYGGVLGYRSSGYSYVYYLTSDNVNVSGYAYVGGIAGNSYYLYYCKSNNDTVIASNNYAGGIAGSSSSNLYSQSTNCYVKGLNYVGGISGNGTSQGSNSSSTNTFATNCHIEGQNYVGGITGSGSISGGAYAINDTIIGTSYVGGLAGSGSASSAYAKNLYIQGASYVGGMVGQSSGYSTNSYTMNCKVRGVSYVGGFQGTGSSYGGANCYATNKVDRISGTSATFGGFTGNQTGDTRNFSGYYADTWAGTDGGGLNWSDTMQYDYTKKAQMGVEMTEADMQTDCFVHLLAKSSSAGYASVSYNIWQKDDGSPGNGGFPTLTWTGWGTNPATYDPATTDCMPVLGRSNACGDYQLTNHTNSNYTSTLGTSSNPYIIANKEDLAVLSRFVRNDLTPYNSGNNTYNCYFSLTADLDLSSYTNWTPIGGRFLDSVHFAPAPEWFRFGGIFDGQNHLISNLKVNYAGQFNGLFGNSYSPNFSSTNISNLRFFKPNVRGTGYTAALSGYSYGTYNNIRIDSATIVGSGGDYVGGIIGYRGILNNDTITNSSITGGRNYVGSMAGYGYGNVSYCFVNNCNISGSGSYTGGISGTNSSYTFTDCAVKNSNISGNSDVGGIAGQGYNFSNCIVHKISVTGTSSEVGGMSGYNSNGSISNCTADSISVTGANYVGGLNGNNYYGSITNSQITNSSVKGTSNNVGGMIGYSSYNSSINTSYALMVKVEGNQYVGGLYGYGYYGTITNSYAMGDTVKGVSNVGGLKGYAYPSNGSYMTSNSYSTMKISRKSGNNTTFGGLAGNSAPSYANSYYATNWRGIDASGNDWANVPDGADFGDPVTILDMRTNCFVLYLLGTNSKTTGAWQRAQSGENDDTPVLRREARGSDAVDEQAMGLCFPVLGYGNYRLTTSPPDSLFDANIGASADNPYLLAAPADFTTLSRFVKDDYHNIANGNTYQKYFFVTTDVNMSSVPNFTPIGGRNRSGKLAYDQNSFCGIMDGNNKVISNYTINSSTDYTGFFGIMSNDAGVGLVRNFNLAAPNITSSGQYTGGFCGMYGRFTNCNVVGGIVRGNNSYTGGFSGAYGTFANCIVDGTSVTGRNYTGGFSGYTQYTTTTTFLNCAANNVNVSASGYQYVGGFIGYMMKYNASNTNITNCFTRNTNVTGYSYVGGFIGQLALYSTGSPTYWNYVPPIHNAFASGGKVTGSSTNVGGFAGAVPIEEGRTDNFLFNIYSTDTVYGSTSSTGYAGGLIGRGGYNSTWINQPAVGHYFNQWRGGSTYNPSWQAGTQQTPATMQAAAFVNTINAGSNPANPFMQDPADHNYGYPVFKWDEIKVNNIAATNFVADTNGSGQIVCSARLNAYILNAGFIDSVGTYFFRYRMKLAGNTYSAWTIAPAVKRHPDTINFYKADLTNLVFDTTYQFQAFVLTGNLSNPLPGDTIFAPDTLSFYTKDYLVLALVPTDIAYSNFTMNGLVDVWTGYAAISSLQFQYWKGAPTITSPTITTIPISPASLAVSDSISYAIAPHTLDHSSQYSYRVVVIRGGDTIRSVIQTTWTKMFTLQTLQPSTSIGEADINASVVFNGAKPSNINFEWWEYDSAVTNRVGSSHIVSVGDDSTSGNRTANIQNLTTLHTYAYRIYATFDGSVRNSDTMKFVSKLFNYPITTIRTGKTITITDAIIADTTITINGVLPRFRIEDGGSLINLTTSPFMPINNNPVIERKLLNERYLFVSSPRDTMSAKTYLGITGGLDNPIYGNPENGYGVSILYFMYDYNAWNDNFSYMTYLGRNSKMYPGEGYFAYMLDADFESNGTSYATPQGTEVKNITTGGNLYYRDTTITLTNEGPVHTYYSQIDAMWYSLGNPYPANMWAKNFIDTNANELSTQYIYRFKPDQTWQPLGANASDSIKMGEGFFVSGKDGVNSRTHSFAFKNSHTVHPAKKSSVIDSKISINVIANGNNANATMFINQNAQNGFDQYDAYKILGWNYDICEPYFIIDDNAAAFNSIATIPYECPLNINAYKDNRIEIRFADIPEGLDVFLIDNGLETKVYNGYSYNTEIDAGSNDNRFKIRIKGNALNDVASNDISMWIAEDRLNINGENLKDVVIYNALGQVVYGKNISGNAFSDMLAIPDGTYTAKTTSKKASKTIKFVIVH
ncbi:MAG: T9SS type A sorting domain-containing protein [Bacteroidales bacterium]|jgi:hypothetical protein|nr:T9SS type A sorting domain-containing protein [Bacteroidales bacterium]